MARPLIKIDWDNFDKLCGLQCTLSEIAGFFECSEDTIERAVKREKNSSFAEYYSKKRQNGCISLRRKMYDTAINGNVTMMIWLSKQYLGMSDKVEEKSVQEVKNEVSYVAAWGSTQEPMDDTNLKADPVRSAPSTAKNT